MTKKPAYFSIFRFFSNFKAYRQFTASTPDERSIVFYSESGQDWHHFRPVIIKLLETSGPVWYITSDRNDPGLSFSHKDFSSCCIEMGFWLITLFQFLKADCLVLTMIDLNVFHLKRSIHPVHYIYLFHSMSSTHMVDFENSYDHYDTILCVGQHQIDEIRARERQKNLPAKNLIPHGYARIEELMRASRDHYHSPVMPYTVLIAPTWGPASILPICGETLISQLLDTGFKVILRPHYQTNRLTPEVVDAILAKHQGNANFSYVNSMGDTQSLFDSDLLICDWSSTSIEYALGLEKPVLYIDVPKRVRNEQYTELGIEPLEIGIRPAVGTVLSPDELDKAPEAIRRLLENPALYREKIAALRKKVLFNVGKSVDVGAREISRIAATLRDKRHSSS